MKKIVALYDKTAERYGNPTLVVNLAVAERDFATGCKEPKSPMMQFPGDISIKYLGEFDEEKGIIIPLKEPVTIAEAKNYVKLNEPIKEATIIKDPSIETIKEKFKNGQIDRELNAYAKKIEERKGE